MMNGRTGWRAIAAVCVAPAVLLAACQSSDVQALPPVEEEAADPATSSSSSSVTTATTDSTTTETTVSELAQAEAAIEAAIVGWWTFPTDSSLGDAGQPLEFVTGALDQRLRSLNNSRSDAGEVQRARGSQRVRIDSFDVDLAAGTAEVDLCTLADDELIDAATGQVIAVDAPQAFEGFAIVELVGNDWKVADFFTTQSGDDPVECEVDGGIGADG